MIPGVGGLTLSLLVQDDPVAKKKHGGPRDGSGRPKTGRNDVAVKVDRAVASKAKAVAQHLGVPLGEIMTDAARATVDRMYAKMLRELEVSGG
jgi:hypothetical protein